MASMSEWSWQRCQLCQPAVLQWHSWWTSLELKIILLIYCSLVCKNDRWIGEMSVRNDIHFLRFHSIPFLFPSEFWMIDKSCEGVGIGLIFDGESRWRGETVFSVAIDVRECQWCDAECSSTFLLLPALRCSSLFLVVARSSSVFCSLTSQSIFTQHCSTVYGLSGYPWSHCLFTRVTVRYVYAFNWDSLTIQVWIRIERRLSNCDGLQLAYLCCNTSAIVAFDGIHGINSVNSLPTQCMPTIGPLNTLIAVQTVRIGDRIDSERSDWLTETTGADDSIYHLFEFNCTTFWFVKLLLSWLLSGSCHATVIHR